MPEFYLTKGFRCGIIIVSNLKRRAWGTHSPPCSGFHGDKIYGGETAMDKETKQVRFTGESKHCFLNASGIPVSLKKAAPRFYEVLMAEYKLSNE